MQHDDASVRLAHEFEREIAIRELAHGWHSAETRKLLEDLTKKDGDRDVRLAALGAVRDHNGYFAARTIEKMLLGIPQTNVKGGQVYPLSPAARASDHFGELDGMGIKAERVQRTIEALIEGGYLQLSERAIRAKGISYTAVSITQRGRDALAGGVELPAFREVEALS